MQVDNTVKLAGSVVYWVVGDSYGYDELHDGFRRAGFEKQMPERMSERSALRWALDDVFPDCNTFPVKGDGVSSPTVEVIRVSKIDGEDRNEFEHVCTAKITPLGISSNAEPEVHASIDSLYKMKRLCVPGHNLSRSLVEIVQLLQGTTLRPNGGVYWVPNESFERWERIANAVELAGEKNKTFALRTIMDEHAAIALREAITNEINREAALIAEIIRDPSTTTRGTASAVNRANNLRIKIAGYESNYSLTLAHLHTAMEEATEQEAIATILNAASYGPLFSVQ